MKGDFTRDTFDRTKHYSRVLMQQGRVTLDADWNEQTAILLHYLAHAGFRRLRPARRPIGQSRLRDHRQTTALRWHTAWRRSARARAPKVVETRSSMATC